MDPQHIEWQVTGKGEEAAVASNPLRNWRLQRALVLKHGDLVVVSQFGAAGVEGWRGRGEK
jgi:hypothetical protein